MEGVWRHVQHMDHKIRRYCMTFSFSNQTSWINLYKTTKQQCHEHLSRKQNFYVRYKTARQIHLTGRWDIGLQEIQYPLSWFNIEQWVGNFTVYATNVADIENYQKVVYGLKLPVGYVSSHIKLAE